MRTYLRILMHGRPYFWMGALALGFMLLATVFGAISLASVIPFLNILFSDHSETILQVPDMEFSLFNPKALEAHAYYQLDSLIQEVGKMNTLSYFCVALLITTLIKNISRYLSAFFIAPLEQGVIYSLRGRVFKHLSVLGLPFYTRKKKGDIIGVLVSDIQVVQESVISTVQSVLRDPLTIIVYLAALLIISWKLTLFSLIVLPVTALFIDKIRRPLKLLGLKGQEVLGELVGIVDEFISGIRIVKAFQKEQFEVDRYQKKNAAYTSMQISIRRRVELASPFTEVISILVVCAIILYGGSLILGEGNSELKSEAFIGFIAFFSQFIAPIKAFSNAISKIQKGIAAYDRIEELLNESASVQDVTAPQRLHSFEQTISFEHIYFKYQQEEVIKDVSFRVEKGQTVALVGPSGGGKSTLADLIPRFYDPYKGKITIDGINIRQLKLSDLRALIGYVTQEGVLFHDTVLNNIAYGIAHPDRPAVIEAARVANAEDFIMQLPQQYDTVIGERGTMLSGGQRQRISIARAVLRNPPILILDEATSNLDTESEKLVQDALEKLMSNRTSIVIAHRLSTILTADQILTVEKGRIIESGTHAELIQTGGMYKRLYELQFGQLTDSRGENI